MLNFFQHEKPTVLTLSHQPFNDRQGITVLSGFKKSKMDETFKIKVAGSGTETYSLLNQLPASTMSHAQIIDNLTRTLYEIHQNTKVLLLSELNEEEGLVSNMEKN